MKHSAPIILGIATLLCAIYFRYDVQQFQSALLVHDRLTSKLAICGFQSGVWQCRYQASLSDWTKP
jgi:hypothetical protein